tara:strand:+ start:4362 stop:4970 length:609 start_codon:yes stop_codon:yes gene_type:complete
MVIALTRPNLNTHINTVFRRHELHHINPIFNSLYAYSIAKKNEFSESPECSEVDMLRSYSRNIREGQYYVQFHSKTNDTIYLGWTPLMDEKRMIHFTESSMKPRRNDNDGIAYKQVPVYFILMEMNQTNSSLRVDKIIANPTIEIDVDISLLKRDLIEYSKCINTTIDFNPLIKFDSGRWFLVWASHLFDHAYNDEYPENYE